MIKDRPTAAPPYFPYKHRTLKEVDEGMCRDCHGISIKWQHFECGRCHNTGKEPDDPAS